MPADRQPVDRILDFAVFLPIGTTMFVRDATKLAAQTGLHVAGRVAAGIATASLDLLVSRAEPVDLIDPEPSESSEPPHSSRRTTSAATPPPTTAPTAPDNVATTPAARADDTGVGTPLVAELPIEGYDHLAARHVIGKLGELNADELDAIERYETANRNRQTVLGRIVQLRGT